MNDYDPTKGADDSSELPSLSPKDEALVEELVGKLEAEWAVLMEAGAALDPEQVAQQKTLEELVAAVDAAPGEALELEVFERVIAMLTEYLALDIDLNRVLAEEIRSRLGDRIMRMMLDKLPKKDVGDVKKSTERFVDRQNDRLKADREKRRTRRAIGSSAAEGSLGGRVKRIMAERKAANNQPSIDTPDSEA